MENHKAVKEDCASVPGMKIIADENIPLVKEAFGRIGDVETMPGREMSRENIQAADVLLVRSITRVDEGLLEGTNVKFVATATIGTDHVDEAYLRRKGIGFAAAPGSNANSVAEYIIAALLVLAERHAFILEGMTLAIVGVGNVGSKVQKKAEALGMRTILNDPPLFRTTRHEKYRPLDEVFSADIVTLHVPLTFKGEDRTHHLADARFFNRMKQNAFFINSARGGVMDTSALLPALSESRIKGAVLDVWENEPNIDAALLELADIGTPHIAGYSLDGKVNGTAMIFGAACAHFKTDEQWNLQEAMPAPPLKNIDVECNGADEQIIRTTVRRLYDIEEDDARLRRILSQKENEREMFFDALRKDYPVRREFSNTKLVLKDCSDKLKSKFKGLGFSVEE
jgi:erythronate-4-phosphate dehydrogenase